MIGRKVKTEGMNRQTVIGTVTEVVRSGGVHGYTLYTIEVDQECHDRVMETFLSRTEWSVKFI